MPKKSLWKHVCVVELLVSIYFLFIKNVSFYKFEHDICNVISFGRYILVSKYNSSLISVLIAVKNTPAVTAYRHRWHQRQWNGDFLRLLLQRMINNLFLNKFKNIKSLSRLYRKISEHEDSQSISTKQSTVQNIKTIRD